MWTPQAARLGALDHVGRTELKGYLRDPIFEDIMTWCMYLDREANVQIVIEPMVWATSVQQAPQNRLPDFSDYAYWAICTAPSQFSADFPKAMGEKVEFLHDVTRPWHADLDFVLDRAAHDLTTCVPVLSSKPDIEIDSTGQTGLVTLIGDASHPMRPMGGSSADTVVRNAVDLASTIADEGVSAKSIGQFEKRMAGRAK